MQDDGFATEPSGITEVAKGQETFETNNNVF